MTCLFKEERGRAINVLTAGGSQKAVASELECTVAVMYRFET